MSAHELYRRIVREDGVLTPEEVRIIFSQIRKNTAVIDDYVARLHLIVNREGHRAREDFVENIRTRLYLLMEENDTFRKVYWRHTLKTEAHTLDGCPACARYEALHFRR